MPRKKKTPAEMYPDFPGTTPATREELAEWIRTHLRLNIGSQAMLQGHASPLDYLCHSFFDGTDAQPGETPRDLVVWANRGGGKTFHGAIATLLDLIFKPGIEIRVLGGSAAQALRMIEYLSDFFDPQKFPALAAQLKRKATGRKIQLRNGSSCNILAQSQTSVRGTRVQILRCDEVDIFKPEIWAAAQFVTRSKQCGPFHVSGRIECLSTMHLPQGVMHGVIEEAKRGTRKLFKWGVLDVLQTCPPDRECAGCALEPECAGRAKNIPPPGGHFSIQDAISQKGRASPGDWQSEMLCTKPRRSAAVLPDFDAALHVGRWEFDGRTLTPSDASRPPHVPVPVASLLCGMDFGIRGDGVTLWAVHLASGALFVLDESIAAGLTIVQQADLIIAGNPGEDHAPWPVPHWIGCDPAGNNQDHHGKTCVQTLRTKGLAVRFSRGALQEGLEHIRARLRPADGSPPRLFVHERCAKLIEAMTRYHYPADRPDSLIPVKDGFDHPVDGLRYLIRALEGGGTKSGKYTA